MIHVVDAELVSSILKYRLAYACEDCAQFDPEGERCTFGYPSEPHRRAELSVQATLTFCKAFELV